MFVCWLCSFLRLKWFLAFKSDDLKKMMCLCVLSDIKGYLKLDLFGVLSLAIWCVPTKGNICNSVMAPTKAEIWFQPDYSRSWKPTYLYIQISRVLIKQQNILRISISRKMIWYLVKSKFSEDLCFQLLNLLKTVFSLWRRHHKPKHLKLFWICNNNNTKTA